MTSEHFVIVETHLTKRIEILAYWLAEWDAGFRGLLPCLWKWMSELYFQQVTLDAQTKARGLHREIKEYFIHQTMEKISEEEIADYLVDLIG